MRPASIPVMIISYIGLTMLLAGEMYYVFIGPHPDASGSIQENVLNPLFWSDHPGISLAVLGTILLIVGHILLSRADRKEAKLTDPGLATRARPDAERARV